MKHRESIEQEKVIQWLRLQYANAIFTGGFAGEKLSIGQAIRRKRMGYRAGTPDIMCLEPKGKYHGLMIEMKAIDGGIVSPEQKAFLAGLATRGYATLVCHGAQEAIKGITEYMEGK